jgi:hypothetical protein
MQQRASNRLRSWQEEQRSMFMRLLNNQYWGVVLFLLFLAGSLGSSSSSYGSAVNAPIDEREMSAAAADHHNYLPIVHRADPAGGNYFYLSPTGDDSHAGTSESTAWATFDRAWQSLYPGDTLILLDGIYYQSLRPNRRNGEPGKPITIRAKNDGQAVIDGEHQRVPVQLGDTWPGPIGNYFVVEGIVAKNSSDRVWRVVGSNNVLKRVSGYNANVDRNAHVFSLGGNNNLLEDCVAAGSGRKMILVFQGERRNIIRRCFAGWQEWRGGDFCPGHIPWGENIETYNSSYNVIENSIGYGRTPRPGGGINVFGQSGANAVGNRVLGSIAMNVGMNWDGSDIEWACPYPGSSCTTCWDPGWLTHRSGFGLGNPNGGSITNNIFQDIFSFGSGGLGFAIDIPSASQYQNQLIRATLVNNGIGAGIRAGRCDNPNDLGCEKERSIQLSRINAFGDFEDNQIECTPAQQPYCTGSEFNGQGARIEYRYHSYFDDNNNIVTTLTDVSLWPWPMEDRIRDEFNIHLSMYHAQTPELANFSVTSTITPILAQYGAIDEPVIVPSRTLNINLLGSPVSNPLLPFCELDIP